MFEKTRILIVDDIEFNRDLIRGFLSGDQFTFIEAANGLEAIERARQHSPDLVLLDMRMPVMDGYEVAAKLKSDPQLRHIPLIAVTASVLEQDRARVEKNCEGYLRKPFRRRELIRALMEHLPYSLRESAACLRKEGSRRSAEGEGRVAYLPPELVRSMLDAAELADVAQIERLLEEVKRIDAPFAASLMRHVERFDYDAFRRSLAGEEHDG